MERDRQLIHRNPMLLSKVTGLGTIRVISHRGRILGICNRRIYPAYTNRDIEISSRKLWQTDSLFDSPE